MLTVHESGGKTVWVDLWNPTPEELATACHEYGLDIPPRDQLEEIEFSSRLQYEDGVFTVSVPVTPHSKGGEMDQTSPLGRAVIGGLLFSTFATLLVLPLVFAWVQGKTTTDSVSLDPEDKESKFYVPLHHHEPHKK